MRLFDKEHNQRVLNLLAEQGTELTPDELVEMRKEIFSRLRTRLRALGWDVPDNDEELFKLITEVYENK